MGFEGYDENVRQQAAAKLIELYAGQGNLDELATEYDAKLKAKPTDLSLNYLVAVTRLRQGKVEAAKELSGEFLKAKGRQADQYISQLAAEYTKAGALDDAVPLYEKLVERTSDPRQSMRYYQQLGEAYYNSNNKQKAREMWRKQFELAKNQALTGRGSSWEIQEAAQVFERHQMYDEAASAHFDAYIQLAKAPSSSGGGFSTSGGGSGGVLRVQTEVERRQQNLIDAFGRLNRLNALVQMLEKQLEASKGERDLSAALWELMAAIHARQEDFDKAANAYEGALKFKPGDVLNAYRLAATLKRAGKDKPAEEALKKADTLRTGPADMHFQIKIAQICQEGKFYEQAIKRYKQAMTMAPPQYGSHGPDFRFGLARLYMEAEKFDLALEAYEELAVSARDEYPRRQANEQMQQLYQQPQLYEQNVAKFKQRIETDPGDVKAHRSLAKLYEARRLPKEAIAHYQRVVELEPGDYNSHRRLGQLYRNAKNQKAATESLKKAAETAPNQNERRNIYRELLQSYAQAKQDEQALEIYVQQMQEMPSTPRYDSSYYSDEIRVRVLTGRERQQQNLLRAYRDQNRAAGLIGLLEKKLAEVESPQSKGQAGSLPYWELVGAFYAQQSQFDKAANAYEQVMKLKKDILTAYKLAAIYQRTGKREKAQEMLKEATGDANFHLKIAQVCREGRLYEQAIEAYKRAMTMIPSHDRWEFDYIRFELARAYMDAGESELALSEYEGLATSAREEHHRRQANEQLQQLYSQPQIYEQNVKRFKSRIEKNPDDANAHHSLAKLYEARGMVDEAIAQYEQAAKLKPGDFNIRRKLGELHQKAKDFSAAEQDFKQALQIAQNQGERDTTIRALWNLYAEEGKIERAIAEFEEFTAEDHNEALAYELLGDAHKSQGDVEKANEAYDRWFDLRRTAIRPDRGAYEYRNLADYCLRKGVKLAGALELAQRAVERENSTYMQRTLAQAYMANEQYEQAIKTYEQVGLSDYERYRQQAETGIWNAYKQGNLYALAIEKYRKQVESSPKDMPAHLNLGRAYEESGKTAEALVAYRAAIKETLGDDFFSGDRATFARKLWGLYDASKKYAEAVETFTSIADSAPRDALAYELLGDAYKKSGDETNANAAYTQWFDLRKEELETPRGNDAKLFADLAKGCLDKDFQPDVALSYIQKAVALQGEDANFIETLAYAYLKVGQHERAKYELKGDASINRSKNGWKTLIEASHPHLDERGFAVFWRDVKNSLPQNTKLQINLALAEFYQEQDKPEEAKKQWAKMGFLPESNWWLVGPFPNPGGGAFAKPYPPEEQVDLEATYQGTQGAVKWERHTDGSDDGKVDLRELFEPHEWAIAYAYTSVHSPEEQEVELRSGSDDDLKIWLNGEEVLSENVARNAKLDQDVVQAKLKAGENHILLKICNRTVAWEFYFRILAGKPAPSFAQRTLSGQEVKLTDFKGKVVLLNFWATWCPASMREMVALEKLYQEHKDDLMVIGISVDSDEDVAKAYIEKRKITYPIIMSTRAIIDAYETAIDEPIDTIPTTIIIGKGNTIKEKRVGVQRKEAFQQAYESATASR